MDWEIAALIAMGLAAWLWFDSMRARERAVRAGQAACARDSLQFLDETVECVHVRPGGTAGGRGCVPARRRPPAPACSSSTRLSNACTSGRRATPRGG